MCAFHLFIWRLFYGRKTLRATKQFFNFMVYNNNMRIGHFYNRKLKKKLSFFLFYISTIWQSFEKLLKSSAFRIRNIFFLRKNRDLRRKKLKVSKGGFYVKMEMEEIQQTPFHIHYLIFFIPQADSKNLTKKMESTVKWQKIHSVLVEKWHWISWKGWNNGDLIGDKRKFAFQRLFCTNI